MREITLPRNLTANAEKRGRSSWVSALPAVVTRVRNEWSLESIDEPFQPGGQTAWVAPARSEEFGDVVVKIAARHYEAFDEARGLREWNGDGAIRLFASEEYDDTTAVLLLERCRPGSSLAESEEEEVKDEVIAGLLRQLWKRGPRTQAFRPLSQMCDQWADGCESWVTKQQGNVDVGLMHEGINLFRSLPRDATPQVLLCTDLHAENVLAAEREPWLMIDPKPYVGDPTYDVLQHILNCEDRLASDPHLLVTRMAELLDLDADRVALWLFARCVVGAADWPELLPIAERLAVR